MEQKKLGIIGGLGPMASAQFLALLTAMTDAQTDQDHIETILYSRPATPDRTAFLLGKSTDSPLPKLLASAKTLENMGAEVLAMPCMTAYSFSAELSAAVCAKLVNPITETASLLRMQGHRKIGILATDGTLQVGLFQKALSAQELAFCVPDEKHQKLVMHLIYENVKKGQPADLDMLEETARYFRAQGADRMILGCTELSVIKQTQTVGEGFLDAMEVLAARAVEACGYRCKIEPMAL